MGYCPAEIQLLFERTALHLLFFFFIGPFDTLLCGYRIAERLVKFRERKEKCTDNRTVRMVKYFWRVVALEIIFLNVLIDNPRSIESYKNCNVFANLENLFQTCSNIENFAYLISSEISKYFSKSQSTQSTSTFQKMK